MDELIYLDKYVLQKDMRIRLPKSILENLNAVKGETMFSILLDKRHNRIILEALNTDTKESDDKETGE